MTNFLDLPSELRAQILAHVAGYCARAPTEQQSNRCFRSCRPLRRKNSVEDGVRSADCLVYPDLASLSLPPIYRVSRQIRQEALVVTLPPQPAEYHLDLVIYKRRKLIPTWTFISGLSHNVDVLKCTIRLHGTFVTTPLYDDGFVSGRRYHPGSLRIPPMYYAFYEVMTQFFQYGPRLRECTDNRHRGEYFIQKLIIDIQSPELEATLSWWPMLAQGENELQEHEARLHPQHIHDQLVIWMEKLMDYSTWFGKVGTSMYAHVGHIEFRRDGVTSKTFDLDSIWSLDKGIPRLEDSPCAVQSQCPRMHAFKLRDYYTWQMWFPLAQNLRNDRGLGARRSRRLLGSAQKTEASDGDLYRSWDDCTKMVTEMRPELNYRICTARP